MPATRNSLIALARSAHLPLNAARVSNPDPRRVLDDATTAPRKSHLDAVLGSLPEEATRAVADLDPRFLNRRFPAEALRKLADRHSPDASHADPLSHADLPAPHDAA